MSRKRELTEEEKAARELLIRHSNTWYGHSAFLKYFDREWIDVEDAIRAIIEVDQSHKTGNPI